MKNVFRKIADSTTCRKKNRKAKSNLCAFGLRLQGNIEISVLPFSYSKTTKLKSTDSTETVEKIKTLFQHFHRVSSIIRILLELI